MNLGKTIVLAIILALTLSACVQKAEQSSTPHENSDTTSVSSSPLPTEQDNPDNKSDIRLDTFFFLGGANTEHGLYFTTQNQNAATLINYIDYEANVQTVLCNRPECTHSDDSCNAYTEYSGNIINVFDINESLYLVHSGAMPADFDYFGEAALPRIEKMSYNGSGRETLVTFESNVIPTGNIAYNEENLFLILQITVQTEQGIEVEYHLAQISQITGEYSTQLLENFISPQIAGTIDDKLIIKSLTSEIATMDNEYVLHLTDGTEHEPLYSWNNATAMHKTQADKLYLLDRKTTQLKIVDLRTGQESVIYERLYDGEVAGVGLDYIVDNKLLCYISLADFSQKLFYAELNGGGVYPHELMVKSEKLQEENLLVEIVGYNDENYIVADSIEMESIAFTQNDGSTVNFPVQVFSFSSITKTDFHEGLENYIKIPLV